MAAWREMLKQGPRSAPRTQTRPHLSGHKQVSAERREIPRQVALPLVLLRLFPKPVPILTVLFRCPSPPSPNLPTLNSLYLEQFQGGTMASPMAHLEMAWGRHVGRHNGSILELGGGEEMPKIMQQAKEFCRTRDCPTPNAITSMLRTESHSHTEPHNLALDYGFSPGEFSAALFRQQKLGNNLNGH